MRMVAKTAAATTGMRIGAALSANQIAATPTRIHKAISGRVAMALIVVRHADILGARGAGSEEACGPSSGRRGVN